MDASSRRPAGSCLPHPSHPPIIYARANSRRRPAGNGALAQCMCGAVVDVAAMLCALPPVEQGAGEGAELLPYPAAVRHNDCFHVYQASRLGSKAS